MFFLPLFSGTTVTGVNLVPGTGSIVITGYAPEISQGQHISPNVGNIEITGYAPTVSRGQHLVPDVGSIVITGYAPTVEQFYSLAMTTTQAKRLNAVIRLHGLIDPLVVTPTSRGDGTVTQTMSGTGPVTVHTTALPSEMPTAAMIDKLSRWYGLIDDMVESSASRTDGTLSQTVVTVGDTTTVTP